MVISRRSCLVLRTFCVEGFCCGGTVHGSRHKSNSRGREKLFWSGLDLTGLRSLTGVLFWHKCLGLMNVFVKDEVTRVVLLMKYIKQNEPFMRLRPGLWGPTLNLSIGKQATAAAKATGVPLFLKSEGLEN